MKSNVKSFLTRETRPLKQAAKIAEIEANVISANCWKAKNGRYMKTKEKLFYRLLLGLNDEIIAYFLDDKHFIDNGLYLQGRPQSTRSYLKRNMNNAFNKELASANADEIRL